MQLQIDTTEYGKVVFVLSEKGKKDIIKSFSVKPHESSRILQHLDGFLKENKIKYPAKEIKSLLIYRGSGSFTGLRIGAAVGQALSMAWGVKLTTKLKKSAIL